MLNADGGCDVEVTASVKCAWKKFLRLLTYSVWEGIR